MAGVVNNPNDPNNPFFGTDADPRSPFVSPYNVNRPYKSPYYDPKYGKNATFGQINPPQDFGDLMQFISQNPSSLNTGPMAPKPMPMPNQPIIDRPAPGYGQQPTRGPAPRDMTPMTLQQGLGGLKR